MHQKRKGKSFKTRVTVVVHLFHRTKMHNWPTLLQPLWNKCQELRRPAAVKA